MFEGKYAELAKKAASLGNQRTTETHFHTFCHWKATKEYHKTNYVLHVMRLLGQINSKNLLICTQLINIQDDDYVCKAAKTIQEATQVIKGAFESATEIEDYKLFRKRK
jgi:hypothetical protein